MILRLEPSWQSGVWKKLLAEAVCDAQSLFSLLGLDDQAGVFCHQAGVDFKLRVPRHFVGLMARGDVDDPLLKQVLPVKDELVESPGFCVDPLAELSQNPLPGLVHKYKSRVLLVTTGACAINCRYCFRRHFPYEDNRLSASFEDSLDYIRCHPEVNEVIFSGGDPLLLPDSVLFRLVRAVAAVPHVRRVRFHSRLPVVLPQRVDGGFLSELSKLDVDVVLVVHCNHPQEVSGEMREALRCLQGLGVTLLNQAVLLKGVNDDAGVLGELSEVLFSCGVLPYYLHLLDKVQGAAHFEVCEQRALEIMEGLLGALPGFLVPRLVREVAGVGFKVPVF